MIEVVSSDEELHKVVEALLDQGVSPNFVDNQASLVCTCLHYLICKYMTLLAGVLCIL